jgi:hypothetical protein
VNSCAQPRRDRARALWALLGLLVAPFAPGCLLFTDSFNQAATVEVMGPTSLFRGQPGTFHAKANEEIASFDWGLALGACPTSLKAAEEARRNGGPLASTGATADTLVHPFVEALDGCVFVIVVDKQGARSFAGKALKVRQRELVIQAPTLIERRKPASFTAVFRDDATATSTYRWSVAKNGGTCDEAVTMLAGAPPASARYEFEPPNAKAFCIAVKATDQWNVDSVAKLEVAMVQAGPPVAKISVVTPAAAAATAGQPTLLTQGLFTQYRLSALPPGETMPEPGQTFRWTLAGPSADAAAFEACAAGDAAGALDRPTLCFSTTKAGSYNVALSVTEDGTTANDVLTLAIEDVPPCIRQTSPSLDTGRRIAWLYDQDLVFRVLEVGDDADPVPAPASGRMTQGTFAWARRLAGANPVPFVPFAGETLAGFTLPGRSFAPGDEVEVRVQYQDRIDLTTPAARAGTCQANDGVCERAPGSSCYQWLTWTVVYL